MMWLGRALATARRFRQGVPMFYAIRSVRQTTVLLALFAAANSYWIMRYRVGGLLDVDEAGYFVDGLIYAARLRTDGFVGWIFSAFAPGNVAPGPRLLASALFVFPGVSVAAALFVPTLLGAAMLACVYRLASMMFGTGTRAVLAVVLTATCPLFIDYSRSFGAAMPTALAATAALLAMIESRRFDRLGWSTAFGALVGLMLLCRVMTIALLPGLAAASLLWLLGDGTMPRRRLIGVALSVVAVAIVAAPWYGISLTPILRYLTSFGYGAAAQAYNDHGGYLGRIWANLNAFYLLPHVVVMAIGAAGYAISARRLGWKAALASPVAVVALFTIPGFLMVASSSNMGTGFLLPLLPGTMLIAVGGLSVLSGRDAAIVVAAASAVAVVPKLDLTLPTAVPFSLGGVAVTDGTAPIQHFYRHMNPADPRFPISDEDKARWQGLVRSAATTLHELNPKYTAYATMGYANNINALRLEYFLTYGAPLRITYIEPSAVAPEAYARWLTNAYGAGPICALLVVDDPDASTFARVSPASITTAAASVGMTNATTWPDPIGGAMELWTRPDC